MLTIQQALFILPSKYIQNPIISQNCCHSSLSRHHLLPGLVQQPFNYSQFLFFNLFSTCQMVLSTQHLPSLCSDLHSYFPPIHLFHSAILPSLLMSEHLCTCSSPVLNALFSYCHYVHEIGSSHHSSFPDFLQIFTGWSLPGYPLWCCKPHLAWSPLLLYFILLSTYDYITDQIFYLLICLLPIFPNNGHKLHAAAAKSLQSCLTLGNLIDGSPPGYPVPGILQTRTLEWVAISFSNAWKWKVKVKSCPTQRPRGLQPARLLCPWDFPGEILEWGAIAFSVSSMRARIF